MEIIDNINKTMKDDLIKEIKKNSKISDVHPKYWTY